MVVRRFLVSICAWVPVATAVWADGPAVGPEFQVNSYTTSFQGRPAVAGTSTGDFVVVWTSLGSLEYDTDSSSIQGQRYSSDGNPLGGQFQINSYTTSSQASATVGGADNGGFVVAWESYTSPGLDSDAISVLARRFASDGTPIGSDFQVNSYTTGYQYYPALGVAPNGDFVVVWGTYTFSGADNVWAQRYASDGTPLGGELQLNSYSTGLQGHPAVAVGANGDFVAAWESEGSYGSDTDGRSVQGQRFVSDGSPLGSQFQVNSYTMSHQDRPSIGLGAGGGFVVVWHSSGSYRSDNDNLSVQGQRFASDGTPIGDEFQVNSYATLNQSSPAVGVVETGDFVVVWSSGGSYGSDNDDLSIQGQRYASDGTTLSGQFQVNSYTSDTQYQPSIGVTAGADFVVTWTSRGSAGSDADGRSSQAQRFSPPFFENGFESGDTLAWSTAVP